MMFKKISLATLMTLSLATASFAGTIPGSRTTGSRTGTIIGSRTGTIIGSRTGTIIGSRTGTIIGSRTGIIPTHNEQGFRSRVEEDLLSSLMFLLTNLSW